MSLATNLIFISILQIILTHNGESSIAGSCHLEENGVGGNNKTMDKFGIKCNEHVLDQEYTYSYVPSESEYIVTFDDHYPATKRRHIINSFLEPLLSCDSWSIVLRKEDNPFSKLPTDFDVVKINSPNVSFVLKLAAEKWPGIKNIVPQMRITRKLMTGYQPETDDFVVIDDYADAQSPKDRGDDSYQSILSRKRLSLSYFWPSIHRSKNKRLMGTYAKQVTTLLGADVLWKVGVTGRGVRVGVFDTGIATPDRPAFAGHVADVTDWTFEAAAAIDGNGQVDRRSRDTLGHGTFVCGVVGGTEGACPGLAPDAQLYVFRVFTDAQISYTSWYLDAFNYAILKRIHILNLSIGGPDFLDRPFIDKVWELSANRMIMISSIGNDGPIAGSLNNPADMLDVIGVGGITYDDRLASFSSRGMTTWELPAGYGRVKPDILTYGIVQGPGLNGGCRVLSGTSVASPVVAGAVALLLSATLEQPQNAPKNETTSPRNTEIPRSFNVALLKQILMAGATRLPGLSMFDQGHGKMDLLKSYQILRSYSPGPTNKVVASLNPPYLDAAGASECPYMWPYCSQPIYHSAMPVVVNVTILNPMALTGVILDKPTWHPYLRENGKYLDIHVSHSPLLWPWSGWLAIHVTVHKNAPSQWEGTAAGQINITVQSPSPSGATQQSALIFPLRVKIIRTPPASKRILWDQFHNLNYPPGYCPRDNLLLKDDPMDWNGDHLHTNFRGLYNHLKRAGYYVETLGGPLTCFEAKHYGTLLIVDPEEEFWPAEHLKMAADLRDGLSVIVLADWYNTTVMRHIKFYDENTRHWWIPDTGGANIPALNELLKPWNISLGDRVFEGDYSIGSQLVSYVSGSSITQFPNDPSAILIAPTLKDQGHSVITENRAARVERSVPVLGMYQTKTSDYPTNNSAKTMSQKPGRIVIYGDSNCVDSQKLTRDCFWLMDDFLTYTMTGQVTPALSSNADKVEFIQGNSASWSVKRMPGNKLYRYSKVLSQLNTQTPLTPSPLQHPLKNLLNESLTSNAYAAAEDQTYLNLRPLPTCPFSFNTSPAKESNDSLIPYKLSQGRPIEQKFVHILSKYRAFASFLSGHINAQALAEAQAQIKSIVESKTGLEPKPSEIKKPIPDTPGQPNIWRQSYQMEILSLLAIFFVTLSVILLAIFGIRACLKPRRTAARKIIKVSAPPNETKKKSPSTSKNKPNARRNNSSNPPTPSVPYKSIR